MANLIPIGQINPTNLYETIERCKKSNDDLKGYNDKTVNAYRTALTEANAYLDALFQKDAETGRLNLRRRTSQAIRARRMDMPQS